MGSRNRVAALTAAVFECGLLGAFTFGLAISWCASATADPPPADPATPPPAPSIGPPLTDLGNVLAQNGSAPIGPLGLPDLSAYGPQLLLGQNAAPAAPG